MHKDGRDYRNKVQAGASAVRRRIDRALALLTRGVEALERLAESSQPRSEQPTLKKATRSRPPTPTELDRARADLVAKKLGLVEKK